MKIIFIALLFSVSIAVFGQNVVLNEQFENGIPSDWTLINKDGLIPDSSVATYSNAWITVTDPFDTNAINQCASATSYFTTVGNANRWLISPAITLGGFGNVLSYKAASFDPSFPDNYIIKVGRDVSKPEEFETLVTYLAEAPYWKEHSLEFDTLGFNNETIYIAFVLTSDNGHKLFLDDISFVTEIPLATNELNTLTIQVYPNPTSDFLTVTTNLENTTKAIYSVAGVKLVETTEDTIDVRSLESGIYFVKTNGSNQLVRFVKK